jgi:hypothetical protein
MARADIRVIDNQSEEATEPNISNWEKEQMLRKYGYDIAQTPSHTPNNDPKGDMDYEELCRIEDARIESKRQENHRKANGPRPSSFGGKFDSDTTYSDDVDSGFSFKVDIVSDMNIPKNGYR